MNAGVVGAVVGDLAEVERAGAGRGEEPGERDGRGAGDVEIERLVDVDGRKLDAGVSRAAVSDVDQSSFEAPPRRPVQLQLAVGDASA